MKGKPMNLKSSILAALFWATSLVSNPVFSQDITVVTPTSEAADGLDLQAVAELFKDAKDLEEFEMSLNDPEVGVNNIDLDDNGEVDFIRVMEEASNDAHVIVLQVPLGENEFQDVATIEVEKNGEDNYNMQIRGNEIIYGANFYIAPVQVHVHTWPIIPWIFRPVYHPYRSAFHFGFYPRWWHPWHPVTVHVYRTRTVRYTARATFTVTHATRVTRVTKVNYHASSSTLVKKQTRLTHGGHERTTTVKAGKVEVHNLKTGKETTIKGVRKTTKTEHGASRVPQPLAFISTNA
jgi:hypothetical protein